MRQVAVIGGGLAGLAAAHTLLSHRRVHITLLEASRRLGGQVHTERTSEFVVEHGAEGFLPPDPANAEFLDKLGLKHRLVSQSASLAYALAEGEFEPLEPGEAAATLGLRVTESERGAGLVSFPTGMDELVHALAGPVTAQADVRLSERAVSLHNHGAGWIIETQLRNMVAADSVVVALPHDQAAALISNLDNELAESIRETRSLSSVSLSFAFLRSQVSCPADASGFVMRGAAREAEGLKASSFASAKFPGRAPEGWMLLRAFYRPGPEYPLERPDDWWVARAVAELRPRLRIQGEPGRSWVARWPAALPQYGVAHRRCVEDGIRRLRRLGSIELAGFDGVGVLEAIRSGSQAGSRSQRGAVGSP